MDLEAKAIERIRFASELSLQHYEKPLMCTYSGGKDSDVLLELFKRSGVPFTVQHSHTTADAPQTVYHVRKRFKELEEAGIKCVVNRPMYKGKPTTIWDLIPQKGIPPTRLIRYCCTVLKEPAGKNSFVATGVRKAESSKRQGRNEIETITRNVKDSIKLTVNEVMSADNEESRKMMEHCQLKQKMTVNPIIDWQDKDIWGFIKSEKIVTNELYECGYSRVGCIGCPMAGYKGMLKEFADFPTYKKAYIHAFDRMLIVLKERGREVSWQTGEEVFSWWIQDPTMQGQLSLFDYLNEEV